MHGAATRRCAQHAVVSGQLPWAGVPGDPFARCRAINPLPDVQEASYLLMESIYSGQQLFIFNNY